MIFTIKNISASAYVIPTDKPEADGTLEWDKTTLIVVFIEAGGKTGLGYSYASAVSADLIEQQFGGLLKGKNAFDIIDCWNEMRRAARNLGLQGQVSSAIAAIDTALWDLKARLLGVSLAALMGKIRDSVPIYGSGGFVTYDQREITAQIEAWVNQGINISKIKIGTTLSEDIHRVRWARDALEKEGTLFVDANGAYTAKQALEVAEVLSEYEVKWFEEPVSSDELESLHMIRYNAPPGMNIAAGEYGYDLYYFQRMLHAGAVDVLQIDVSRAQGYTGFMQAASLAMAWGVPISSHCAPALHLPVCCHAPHTLHMEYFYDHVRIEHIMFDGLPKVTSGNLVPSDEPGHGLVFKSRDAQRYAA